MNKNLLIVVILIVLILVGVIQAIQLNDMKNNVDDLEFSGVVKPNSITPNGSTHPIPTNLQNLPGMVGGC